MSLSKSGYSKPSQSCLRVVLELPQFVELSQSHTRVVSNQFCVNKRTLIIIYVLSKMFKIEFFDNRICSIYDKKLILNDILNFFQK